MGFELTLRSGDGFTRIHIVGPTTVENMESLAAVIERVVESMEPRAVLLDCEGMTGALAVADLFRVGEHFAGVVSRCGVRLAAINMPAHWRNNTFSEDVIHNRGGIFRHFGSLADAEKWLRRP